MSKREISKWLEEVKKFEEKHFPLTEEEEDFLNNLHRKNSRLARARLKRASENLEFIATMNNDKQREEVEKAIRPYLFDKEATKELVKTIVMNVEGLLIEIPKVVIIFNKVYPQIKKFHSMFPENVELTEEDTEKELILNIKIKLSKKLLEVRSVTESLEEIMKKRMKR